MTTSPMQTTVFAVCAALTVTGCGGGLPGEGAAGPTTAVTAAPSGGEGQPAASEVASGDGAAGDEGAQPGPSAEGTSAAPGQPGDPAATGGEDGAGSVGDPDDGAGAAPAPEQPAASGQPGTSAQSDDPGTGQPTDGGTDGSAPGAPQPGDPVVDPGQPGASAPTTTQPTEGAPTSSPTPSGGTVSAPGDPAPTDPTAPAPTDTAPATDEPDPTDSAPATDEPAPTDSAPTTDEPAPTDSAPTPSDSGPGDPTDPSSTSPSESGPTSPDEGWSDWYHYGDAAEQKYALLPGEPGRDVVVLVHGGGWVGGRADAFMDESSRKNRVVQRLHDQGLWVATVEYRKADEHPWPATKDDVHAGVTAAVKKARSQGAGRQVGLLGDSAGGHLVALESATHPGTVDAVVGYFGIYDPLTGKKQRRAMGCPKATAAEDHILMHDATDPAVRDRLRRTASPVALASPRTAPTYLLHGDADCVAPAAQSRQMHEALRDKGVDSRLEVVPGADHSQPAFWTEDRHLGRVASWFTDHGVD